MGRLFEEPRDVGGIEGDRAVSDGDPQADGDEGLSGPFLAADEAQRGRVVGGDEAHEGPDQESDAEKHHESTERLRVAEMSPDELGAETTRVTKRDDRNGYRFSGSTIPPWFALRQLKPSTKSWTFSIS